MFELIRQQRYRANGAVVDRPSYRNHDVPTDVPGRPGPGHEVIGFPNAGRHVKIELGRLNAWNPLNA